MRCQQLQVTWVWLFGLRLEPFGAGAAMAVAAISQLRRNVGFMFRETGQALDRLGMSVMADYAYKEPREFSLSLSLS